MPDSPLERAAGGPYDRGMEQRVARLEDAMRDNTAAIARIDVAVVEIRTTLPTLATKAEIAQLATKAEVAELRVDIATLNAKIDNQTDTMHRFLATKEDIGDLRGYVKALPTTWVMVTAIVAGQIGITGVIAGALLAAARMFVHT
jgi:hypothetical protein